MELTEHGAPKAGERVQPEAYRARARAWLAHADIPEMPADYDQRFAVARAWQRTLFDAGWMGIDWPVDFGGRGLTPRHQLIFAEELVRARAPYPIGLIGLDVVGPTIVKFGTDEQRARLVPPLLSGEELWCQGFSEPDAGSDLANLRTSAVRDGDELVVTGQKVWTSWAAEADWCAALVRTDRGEAKHHGITYLLIDMTSPGVTVRPIVQITGDAEFNEVFFEEVRVPVENVVGGFGDGWRLAMDTLGHERGGYAIRRRMENETAFVDLVAELRQAAVDPGLDEAAVRRLGGLFVRLRAFESQARFTVDRFVAGEVPSAWDSIDKLTLSDTEQLLYELAAARGTPNERLLADSSTSAYDSERWAKGLLYARAGSVYGGSSQIQRTIVAERLLGLPRGR